MRMMRHLQVIALLFLFVFSLSSNSTFAQPASGKLEFDKSIVEFKELKRNIVVANIKLEQINKTSQLTEDIDASIKNLNVLNNTAKNKKLSDEALTVINNSLSVIFNFKSKTTLTVMDTQSLLWAMDAIEAKTDAFDPDCVNDQKRKVTATTFDSSKKNKDGQYENADGLYKVMYWLVTQNPEDAEPLQPLQVGKETPATGDLPCARYYFRTQDPGNSTRRGEPLRLLVCKGDISIQLPIPQ